MCCSRAWCSTPWGNTLNLNNRSWTLPFWQWGPTVVQQEAVSWSPFHFHTPQVCFLFFPSTKKKNHLFMAAGNRVMCWHTLKILQGDKKMPSVKLLHTFNANLPPFPVFSNGTWALSRWFSGLSELCSLVDFWQAARQHGIPICLASFNTVSWCFHQRQDWPSHSPLSWYSLSSFVDSWNSLTTWGVLCYASTPAPSQETWILLLHFVSHCTSECPPPHLC